MIDASEIKTLAKKMIMQGHTLVRSRDLRKFAWSALRRFHNTRFVAQIHTELHAVPDKYKKFVLKQAEQIRHCLIQAQEYAYAAEQVSLSTKPVLLYYSCMSLALAEILMKQTGDSSLDLVRKTHNHHGLVLSIDENAVRRSTDFRDAAEAMKAEPMIRGGNQRAGTFELWHRSARSVPAIGKRTIMHSNMTTTFGSDIIVFANDERFENLPRIGINLFDCLCLVPGLNDVLRPHDGTNNFVRSSLSRLIYADDETTRFQGPAYVNFAIHPTTPALLEQWQNGMVFRGPLCDSINFLEAGGGGNLRLNVEHIPFENAVFPSSTNLDENNVVFWPNNKCLNEFGYIYIALHILGNFARYFPDLWMRAVEASHPIATVAERFFEHAEAKMPLATLSELSRSYHVAAS